ncbi:MAG: hypothetical protein LBJ24_05715 [Treponema sp.]|jgi:hypothetical protein|nr:hypothetical protein [Treponema sp.]
MNRRYRSHIFLGSHAPLSTLAGAGLLIMGSVRTAHALLSAGALVWVYALTVLVLTAAKPLLPTRGKTILEIGTASFFGALYLLLCSLFNPFLSMELTLLVLLASVSCIASGICPRTRDLDSGQAVGRALLEGLLLGLLILGLALIREPLGSGSLSVPGGLRGITFFFSYGGFYFPVRIAAVSSGALILLGYVVVLFRHYRGRYIPSEDAE